MAAKTGLTFNSNPSTPSDTPCASSELTTTTTSTTTSSPPLQQALPNIPSSPSTSTIRPRGSSTVSTSSSVKRKPLPSSASPLATRYSSGEHVTPSSDHPEGRFSRSSSVDSPTFYEDHSFHPVPQIPEDIPEESNPPPPSTNNDISHSTTAITPQITSDHLEVSQTPHLTVPSLSRKLSTETVTPGRATQHARLASDITIASTYTDYSHEDLLSGYTESATMSIFSSKPTPPHLNLPDSPPSQNISIDTTNKPKSPGASKLGSFFGWGGATSPASSTASFPDDRNFASTPSPTTSPKKALPRGSPPQRTIPGGIDVPRANSEADNYFGDAFLQLPPGTPASLGSSAQIEGMEEELRTISSELATSIRREMELEDLVERLQGEAANPQGGAGRRTSDYFSDSGTSSVKFGSEIDSRTEEMERLQRTTEREKAQIKLDLTAKVQEERTRRKQLESQIRALEDKASHIDLSSSVSSETGGRLKELENSCEDLRRRLSEERQVKENFEDLLTALKSELQNSHNERDNLRDEVVPQLRARVEGLEAQAAQHEKTTYENTKMQQELQSIRGMSDFNIPRGLSRTTSVKGGESREALADRVKDVEAQRDALHQALKSLLERQEHQNRENAKRLRQLEMERDQALADAPRRQGFDREVENLREEINTLRRRADEAIEQKWQCEKNLGGLKMDLDRAEQEIGSLRILLQDNDIPLPGLRAGNIDRPRSRSAGSEALDKAYKDLQKAYAESLERIKNLESSSPKDEDTERAMAQLEKSLSDALLERDMARKEADTYRQSVDALHTTEKQHMASEVALADELRTSAKRVEELAIQVRNQLASNAALRQRLSETIERGEKEQKVNADRIAFMQNKLRDLEEALVNAQQQSEEHVAKHEEELRTLKESHNKRLLRMKDGLRSPRIFAPKSPVSPLFASNKSPRLDRTTSGKGMSFGEESKTDYLKDKVLELEKALEEADREMEEVVGKMNMAQIEVMELQNEREEAVRQTKRLQAQLEQEKVKSFETRFATLSS